jgi:hypothetical protein
VTEAAREALEDERNDILVSAVSVCRPGLGRSALAAYEPHVVW